MLYEFHQSQKIKKTTLTYATYLVDGTPRITEEQTANGHQQDGGDAHMQSSPFMSSSMPHEENDENMFGSRSIMLAREDDLEGKKGPNGHGPSLEEGPQDVRY